MSEMVLRVGHLAEGEMKQVDVEGRTVLLARVGDEYYAVSGTCPNGGESLAESKLEGTIITCPQHGSQFDLFDGHVVRWDNWNGIQNALFKPFILHRSLKPYRLDFENT